jgi:hypothetical protein
MDTPARKIDQLVADARIELKRLGIETKGKRSDEILNMMREQRNKLRVTQLKLQWLLAELKAQCEGAWGARHFFPLTRLYALDSCPFRLRDHALSQWSHEPYPWPCSARVLASSFWRS